MSVLVPVGRLFDAETEGFNHDAAEEVYGAVMKCADDDEAAMVSRMYLTAMLGHEMITKRVAIGKAVDHYIATRPAAIGKRLVREAVAIARDGGDPGPVLKRLEALDVIAKDVDPDSRSYRAGQAASGFSDAMSSAARAAKAKKQQRDLLTGQFVQEHKDITHLASERPLHDKDAAILGIPAYKGPLSNAQRAQFQRGYREVQDMLAPYSRTLKSHEGAVHLRYETGPSDVISFPAGGRPAIRQTDQRGNVTVEGIDPKRKLTSAQLSVLPSTDFDGPGVQARFGPALGSGGLLNADTWSPDVTGSLGDMLTRSTPEEQYQPGVRAVRRAGSLARAIDTTLGPVLPAKARLALVTAQHAGALTPEAAKVLGPVGDRAAYRYRGTQRKTVDSRLLNALSGHRGPDKREAIIHGTEDDLGNWRPGGVLSYFKAHLPRTDLNTLQRKSGTIPPSEGVIIDSKGKVTVQAVGYADDHYLPFNLRHLTGLKGGEYIRTRTYGGPTTEDVYTGLVGGAKSETIVSHNGVYTLEFDDDLKGGRRYNDKAARMVARYGQLLDAVKSEQVTTGGIHPTRGAELRAEANRVFDPDREPEKNKAEVERLRTAERRNPKFSAAQRQEATAEFFAEAASARRTPDGHVQTAAEMANDFVMGRTREILQRSGLTQGQITPAAVRDTQARVMSEFDSPDPAVAGQKLADAMGLRRQLDAHLKSAESTYKQSLTPLSLNSQGYELALTALQEQFPYYIKRIDFHPWEGGGSPFDTGYVKPKHNRPEGTLAGYFDPTINGHAKVKGDTIRNQNHRKLEFVGRAADKAKEAGARVTGGPVDPAATAVLKDDAVLRIHSAIQSQHVFASGSRVPGGDELTGKDFRTTAALPSATSHLGDLSWLHGISTDELTSQLSTNRVRTLARVDNALRQNETIGALDIDPTTVRAYRRGGLPEERRTIGDHAAQHLGDPLGTEYDFPEPPYNEGSRSDPADLHSIYENDPRVKMLVSAGQLPASPADGAEFERQAGQLRTRLNEQRRALATWTAQRAGGRDPGPTPVAEYELDREAEGLLRAQQLRRRYTEAMSRTTQVATPTGPAAGADQTILVVHTEGGGGLPPALQSILGQ